MNKSSAIDIVLLIIGALLILQFLGGIGFLSFFEGILLVAPFEVVGGALIFVVYYRRKNRALKERAIQGETIDLTILSSSIAFPTGAAQKRPKAATILVIIPAANGVYSLVMAVFPFLLAMVVFVASPQQLESFREEVFGELGSWAGSQQGLQIFLSALSVLLLSLGIASVIAAYGLLKGKKWAWSFAVILAISAIIFDVAFSALFAFSSVSIEEGSEFPPIGIITGGIMLYLLYRTDVKSFLGKGQKPQMPTGNA